MIILVILFRRFLAFLDLVLVIVYLFVLVSLIGWFVFGYNFIFGKVFFILDEVWVVVEVVFRLRLFL